MAVQIEQDAITPRLLQAFKVASALPKDKQDELAQLLEEIADLGWSDAFSAVRSIFAKNSSHHFLSSARIPQTTSNEALNIGYEPLQATLARIQRLANWEKGWPDAEAPAPSQDTVEFAQKRIKEIFRLVAESNSEWSEPNATVGSDADVVLEWWHKSKQLIIYLKTNEPITYLKVWGPDPNTEMADGELPAFHQFLSLWEWLTSEQ